ncbi:RNA ligase family protein [Actinoplanes sp. NPDC051470]|uniref:RNA ligase family protein n=1 Tax=Actinoplanes sp. NPDC051470 TaxID=3157224 RepID=UPI003428348C
MTITEKIDGTNGLVHVERHPWGYAAGFDFNPDTAGIFVVQDLSVINEDGVPQFEWHVRPGSRNRWLTTESDNFGFAAFVRQNAAELVNLGPGNHYGEWFGKGINRGYNLNERWFALFNVARWFDPRWEYAEPYREWFPKAQPAPNCITVVPVIRANVPGDRMTEDVRGALDTLSVVGSFAVPTFKNPEGVVAYHDGARQLFKAFPAGYDQPKSARQSVGT